MNDSGVKTGLIGGRLPSEDIGGKYGTYGGNPRGPDGGTPVNGAGNDAK